MLEQERKIEGERKESWGFPQVQQRLREIYERHDLRCDYGAGTMLAKMNGNASLLEHAVRNPTNTAEISGAVTNIFLWAVSFGNRGQLDLQDILIEKFGNGCPHCNQMPCLLTKGEDCNPTLPKAQATSFPQTLDQWQEHFATIYSNNYDYKGDPKPNLKFAAAKVLTEIAELSGSSYSEIRIDLSPLSFKDGMLPWESEIADILAWNFAMAEHLNRLTGKYSLGKAIEEKYKLGCPRCKSKECICPKEKTFIYDLETGRSIIHTQEH